MKLSIITVNLNNALGLKKTIESVVAQSYQGYEFIVIDGGSTDGSIEVIKQYSDCITFWVSEPDRGIYHAMNNGIRKACGEYLIFLNSGDALVEENTLKNCLNALNVCQPADIYYGAILLKDKNSLNFKCQTYPEVLDLNYFRVTTINHQASIIKANLFQELGLYPENYKLAADYWLYLKSYLNNKRYQYLKFPLVIYDNTGVSAINIELYINEHDLIWNSLVPENIISIINENNKYKKLLNERIIKAAIKLKDALKWL